MKIKTYMLAVVLAFFGGADADAQSRYYESGMDEMGVTVFESGKEGYSTFRIPAIIKAADGALLAFCEGRVGGRSDSGNIDLVMKRSTDGGRTWGPLQVVWDDGGNTCGNPAPVVLPNGDILMLMTWNLGQDHEPQIVKYESQDTRRVFSTRSTDNGRTWSKPVEITAQVKDPSWGWFATGPCHAIVKRRAPHKGRIIVPSNHSELDGEGDDTSRSQMLCSDDGGLTWHIGAISTVHGNESTVAELADGSLIFNMRNYKSGTTRLVGLSADGGETLCREWKDPMLVESRCQASILSTPDGKTLLFCNARSDSSRRYLTLSVSKDNGNTWIKHIVVCPGGSAYNDLVITGRNTVGVLYENASTDDFYKRISFQNINLKK